MRLISIKLISMKSFIRHSIALGLIGSSVVTFWLNSTLNVLALTPKEIVKKLNQIPVYTIGNNKEVLLSHKDNQEIFVTYMSYQDAREVVESITQDNPERQVKVVTLPLGQVYELLRHKLDNKSKGPPDSFLFVPLKEQISPAKSIFKREYPGQQFEGIPLFYGTVTVDKQETFLSVESKKEDVTPFYFERESLEKLIENIKQQQPEFASSIEVKVTSLFAVLTSLEANKQGKKFGESVVLVPSLEAAKKLLETRQQSRQAEQE